MGRTLFYGRAGIAVDRATIIGLLIAFGALVAAVLMDGGSLASLFKPSAFVLIVGGTVGATIVGHREGDLSQVPGLLRSAFRSDDPDPRAIIEQIIKMAEKARREGLLALQDDVPELPTPLLIRGVQLIVDGTDPELVRETMQTQVEMAEERKLHGAAFLEAAGGYAPTIGIIGTVMGLVQALGHIGSPDELAHAIAVAFLATFWGILTANLFWLPLASKVKQNIRYQTLIGRMCITGVTGLQTGEAPRALREKLEIFLSESLPERFFRGGDEE